MTALAVGATLLVPAAPGHGRSACTPFSPATVEAAAAPVAQVTESARRETPLVIDYEHTASVVGPAEQKAYFNIQVYTRWPRAKLFLTQDFDRDSDVNMYLYDERGDEVARAESFNLLPIKVGPVDLERRGKFGYEQMPVVKARRCAGFTLESRAFFTTGTAVRLKIWVARARG